MKSLEKTPWFAILGVLVLLNMLLVQQSPDFIGVVVPAYLSQAIFFIAMGYGFLKEHVSQGFTVFLMGLVWLLQNVLLWSNAEVAGWLWLTFLAQLLLAHYFFTDKTLWFADQSGLPWTYAALWVVFTTGLAKFLIGLSAGLTLAQIPLWGLGVLLVSFGYIIKPVEKEWSIPLILVGVLLCLVSAFTLTVPGLNLLP